MTSRLVPAVLAVHATLSAVAGITAAGARVELGPVVTGDPGDVVWVGFDGTPDGEFRAGMTTSEWAGLGARRRDEDIEVDCAVTALLGDGGVAGALTRIQALFDLVEDALRGAPALAQSAPFVAAAREASLHIPQTTAGIEPRLSFVVAVRTRT